MRSFSCWHARKVCHWYLLFNPFIVISSRGYAAFKNIEKAVIFVNRWLLYNLKGLKKLQQGHCSKQTMKISPVNTFHSCLHVGCCGNLPTDIKIYAIFSWMSGLVEVFPSWGLLTFHRQSFSLKQTGVKLTQGHRQHKSKIAKEAWAFSTHHGRGNVSLIS